MDMAYPQIRDAVMSVTHRRGETEVTMSFHAPNAVCRYRVDTFSTKEPETLEWIDDYGSSGAFFDIGANVGIYSVYYAKTYPGTVYAFEPSVFNLGLLAKNISLNGLDKQIVIVPNPLTSENRVAEFHLSMLDEGGSMSTFGADYGHDGLSLKSQMDYRTMGMSLDFLVESGIVPETPAMIKVDVDGIEHLILRGARSTLASPTLKTVLIEVNDNFHELASEVSDALMAAGFCLAERRHSEMFEGGPFADTFNQIWLRQ
jgi:FkbM family methyltransferase